MMESVSVVTAPHTKSAFERAQQALDETILLALVHGPMKTRHLRAAATPFGNYAFHCALTRLMAIGEIVGEGLTTARVYRLVQRTSIASQSRTVCADGIEYEPVWPTRDDPKAPPTVLRELAEAAR